MSDESAPSADLSIDDEFSKLCWTLEADEERNLRESLQLHGCRSPVIYWTVDGKRVVIDGHNRKRICEELGIFYAVQEMAFADRDAAIVEICREQLGRRNISTRQRHHLLSTMAEHVRQRMAEEVEEDLSDLFKPESVIESVASKAGVSPRTVDRAVAFDKAVTRLAEKAPKTAKAARDGEISVSDAVKLAKLQPDQLAPIENAGEAMKDEVKIILKGSPLPEAPVEHSALAAISELKKHLVLAKKQSKEAVKECGGQQRADEVSFHVSEALKEIEPWIADANGAKTPDEVLDGRGLAVPESLRDVFARAALYRKALNLHKLLTETMNAITTDQFLAPFATERNLHKTALSDMANVRNYLKFTRPYAPCGYCGGGGCQSCVELGAVGRRVFESTPEAA